MVARDPIRKVTLSAHPNFDGSKEGADRWDSPHVGSTKRIPEPEWPEADTVAGRSSSEVAAEESKKSKKSTKKDS